MRYTTRAQLVAATAFFALVAAGCGGAGGGGGGPPPAPDPGGGGTPPPPPSPVALTQVTVTARDAFGAPVAAASIQLLVSSGSRFENIATRTDAAGRAQFEGRFDQPSAVVVTATESKGASYEPRRPSDGRVEFDVVMHPAAADIAGVSRLSVIGVSADRRQLDFKAHLHVIEGTLIHGDYDWGYEGGYWWAIEVDPCALGGEAGCIEGPAGRAGSYEGTVLARWVDQARHLGPWATALLVDQGSGVAVTDPADRRLLAGRYFQTQKNASDSVALAAFAADDSGTGTAALLPEQPVTIFPTGTPAFTTDGLGLFPVIDSLATLEGGASPRHAAIDALIDFVAAEAPADSRGAVVVLASSVADDCGAPADCRAAQDALRAKSEAEDVALVAVGLAGPDGKHDVWNLGTLAQGAQNSVFWARDPAQVPVVVGRLPQVLAGQHGSLEVLVTLRSQQAGAFESGSTVIGQLRIVICPWDCDSSIFVPFALRVP